MSLRFRKSFKVAKGVRFNVSKSGLGASFGVKGARYSIHSSGRRTTSVGIPGSGMSYVTTSKSGIRDSRAASRPKSQTYKSRPKQPGLFAPSGEKATYRAFVNEKGSLTALDRVANEHPDYRSLALTFSSIQRSSIDNETDQAIQDLKKLINQDFDPQTDPFFNKYLTSSVGSVKIASGVTAELPVSKDLIGLVLAELLQQKGELDEAIRVVEGLQPTTYSNLSLTELYLQSKNPDKVIELTNGIENNDDPSALACVYRAVALKNKGLYDAALQAFKESLRFSSRADEIRHLALIQRATLHYKNGKKAQAKKDLERVISQDATFPGVNELLTKFS